MNVSSFASAAAVKSGAFFVDPALSFSFLSILLGFYTPRTSFCLHTQRKYLWMTTTEFRVFFCFFGGGRESSKSFDKNVLKTDPSSLDVVVNFLYVIHLKRTGLD